MGPIPELQITRENQTDVTDMIATRCELFANAGLELATKLRNSQQRGYFDDGRVPFRQPAPQRSGYMKADDRFQLSGDSSATMLPPDFSDAGSSPRSGKGSDVSLDSASFATMIRDGTGVPSQSSSPVRRAAEMDASTPFSQSGIPRTRVRTRSASPAKWQDTGYSSPSRHMYSSLTPAQQRFDGQGRLPRVDGGPQAPAEDEDIKHNNLLTDLRQQISSLQLMRENIVKPTEGIQGSRGAKRPVWHGGAGATQDEDPPVLDPTTAQAKTDALFQNCFEQVSILRDSLQSKMGAKGKFRAGMPGGDAYALSSAKFPPEMHEALGSLDSTVLGIMGADEIQENSKQLQEEFGEFADEVGTLRRMRRGLRSAEVVRHGYTGSMQDKLLEQRLLRLRLEKKEIEKVEQEIREAKLVCSLLSKKVNKGEMQLSKFNDMSPKPGTSSGRQGMTKSMSTGAIGRG